MKLNRPFTITAILLLLFSAGCAPAAAPTAPVIVIAGPATPSSIPLILAAESMGIATVEIVQNASQANTSFLRGDITILATGLSVGIDLRKSGAPVQLLNTYVTGLSYLVTSGKKVSSLAELKGQQIYLPFEGSPIEEATQFLAQQEGLVWGIDLLPIYSPFEASVALLKEGKAQAVVLPEPFVTLVENQPNIFISLDLYTAYNDATGSSNGYPQVGAFANPQWAAQNPEQVAAFNAAMADAIQFIQDHPEEAVAKVKNHFTLPEAVLLRSLQRTHFSLSSGAAMSQDVSSYYSQIGKPLDETFIDLPYLPAK